MAAESNVSLFPDSPSESKNGNSLEHLRVHCPTTGNVLQIRNNTVNVNLKATKKNIKVTHQILPNTNRQWLCQYVCASSYTPA